MNVGAAGVMVEVEVGGGAEVDAGALLKTALRSFWASLPRPSHPLTFFLLLLFSTPMLKI